MERKEGIMLQSKEVSLFKSLYEKDKDLNLTDVLDLIKNGAVQNDLILKIRDLKENNKDYGALKKQLQSFTPCGTFHTKHKATDLKEYSKLIILDIDDLGVRKVVHIKKLAIECLYSLAVFISPSGTGLKILIMIDTDSDMHEVAFEQVKNFYENLLKVEIDPSGKDISRLCFISYDSELHYNFDANIFKVLDKFYADFKSAVISTEGKFQFIDGNRNNFVHFLANNCNRLGIPQKVAETLIQNDYDYDQKEMLTTIKSAYENIVEFSGKDLDKKEVVEEFLSQNYNFRYNLFTSSIELRKLTQNDFEVLDDYKLNSILRELKGKSLKVGKDGLYNILNSDFTPKFHPLKEYIFSLPKWDGETDYIEKLAELLSTDDDVFFKDAFKRWFVAMVACGMQDEVINQTALIFSGKQGIGKSTFIRNLLPDQLRKYCYSGMINPNSKDTLVQLSECLIIDMDELSNLTKKGNNEVKELITKAKIKLRRPYARVDEILPRRASFIGSVNDDEFLTDSTGNRRFLCFKIKSINYISKVDYEMVYAQAMALFENGFKYYFDGNEIEQLNNRNEKFRQKSVVEDLIVANYKPASDIRNAHFYLNSGEFLVKLRNESGISLDATNSIQLGKALNKLEFSKVKKGGRMVYAIDLIQDSQAEMRVAS